MRKRNQGFTLIELVVVIVLLGIVVAFTVPKLETNLFSDSTRVGVRRVVNALRMSRNMAVQSQLPYKFGMEIGANHISSVPDIVPDDNAGDGDKEHGVDKAEVGDAETARPKASPPEEISFDLPKGVRILDVALLGEKPTTSGTVEIRFSPKGYAEQAVIHLIGDDEKAYTIVVTPFLSTIRTIEGYVSSEDI